MLNNVSQLVRRVYFLARPYGGKRLASVFSFTLLQGLFQVIGVTSIFPFLSLAAAPAQFRQSEFGKGILNALPQMDNNQLLFASGLMAILMLVIANGVNLVAEFHRARYVRGLCHWIRMQLLRNIVSRPYSDFLSENSGVQLKKITVDVNQFAAGVLIPLLGSISGALCSLLLICTLLAVDPWITIGATLLFSSFYFAIFWTLGAKRHHIIKGMKIASRGINRESQQLLGGIKAIKVHRAESYFLERIAGHSKEVSQLTAMLPLYQQGPRYVVEPLLFGSVVGTVLISAASGREFTSLLPSLGVMALAGYRLLPAIQLLYSQLTQLSTSQHSLDEVYEEFLKADNAGTPGDAGGGRLQFSIPDALTWTSSIVLDNISFQYPGSPRPIFEHLSLTIPKNSSVGIVGTTGSGKSTLVDIILGLHSASAGKILIDDVRLSPGNVRAWRGGIGYVPQDIFLIDDTIAANIAFGVPLAKVDFARLREVAAAAQILDYIEKELQAQWKCVVGERGVRLSGGQRQRIGLARALYHRPELLILDEATSALDSATESEVMRAIDNLQGKITLIVIAHRLNTVSKCDQKLELGPRTKVVQDILHS